MSLPSGDGVHTLYESNFSGRKVFPPLFGSELIASELKECLDVKDVESVNSGFQHLAIRLTETRGTRRVKY